MRLQALSQVIVGAADIGEALVAHRDVAIISATGSTRMGRAIAPQVAARFGKCILELGGNNAMIVAPSADLDLAVRAIVFSAVGTAGQRCTSLRRLIVHDDVYAALVPRLKAIYQRLEIGDPLSANTLVGPLIDAAAFHAMQRALADGATRRRQRQPAANASHTPRIPMPTTCVRRSSKCRTQTAIVREETFAPILYVMRYHELDHAIALHNDVPQGLASCIFTTDLREAETFLSARGSDCGITNVNIGPSGAEIGGAFGGEKDTGGGRESGSDAWRAYMRRQTSTVNYSRAAAARAGDQVRDLGTVENGLRVRRRPCRCKKIAVLGLGKVGTLAAKLLHEGGFDVTGIDSRQPQEALPFALSRVDLETDAGIGAATAGYDAVLSCLPYRLNQRIATAAHALGMHYFDLTEDVSTTRAIIDLGKNVARVDGAAVRPGARFCRHRRRVASGGVRAMPLAAPARRRVAAESDGTDGLCLQLVARRRRQRIPQRLRSDRGRRPQDGVVDGVDRNGVCRRRDAGGVHDIGRTWDDLRDVSRPGRQRRLQVDALSRPHAPDELLLPRTA